MPGCPFSMDELSPFMVFDPQPVVAFAGVLLPRLALR